MSSLATVRAGLLSTLSGVAGVGQVHDYERWAARAADFKTLYRSSTHGQIRGWFIRWVGRTERSPAVGSYVVRNRWQIRGFMSLDDSAGTEKTFNDLVEAVVLAYRADDTLGGAVDTLIVGDVAGAQVDDAGPVELAGVLCHAARLSLTTQHCE